MTKRLTKTRNSRPLDRLVRRGESVTVWNFKLERFQRVRGRKATMILDAIMNNLRSAPN